MKLENICKRYDDRMILDHLNLELENDGIYCVMAPSGKGKTTLLRILGGLTKADGGNVIWNEKGENAQRRISMVFQEDRLFENVSAVENIRAAIPKLSEQEARTVLSELLPEHSLVQPVRELSGGMKRRAAVVRAMLFDSDLILMDEPFTGLDEAMHKRTAEFILKYRKNRLLLIATHNPEDVVLLNAYQINLN